MRVFIAGVDGYLGWALAQYLTARGHDVAGVDNYARRQWVDEMGSVSAIPIYSMPDRLAAFREHYGKELLFREGDLLDYQFLRDFLSDFQPDAIVHLGEMPSAPYSMIDQAHSIYTHTNNVNGSLNVLWAMREVCPEAHLVKLGTMGEYGTPNVDIPEGFFEIEYRGRKDRLPFPRQPGSFYHLTKVHDTNNTMFACRIWGLSATDIMQGVVFGTQIDTMGANPVLRSRLDFDQCFGTAINRFACQAVIGHPLTVYGVGHQKRGFLPMRDSMQCLTIAIENPPKAGEYRVFNQFEECYTVDELAEKVREAGSAVGLDVDIEHFDNPRTEKEEHYYNPDRQHLIDLGYKPTHDVVAEVKIMLQDLLPQRDRIMAKREIVVPDIRWDGTRRRSGVISASPVKS
ncbi:MAG: NAD-dependent epimerase/dehydratase family protein [Chloroflexi bacterium]|uniref:NAD-dependent epimerase/dehydratase family protein n=1 Tax=Candidatus Flexifilum breve TaxID=3140694 RepID=UPI003135156E|nr:NAD-dependent epimerase/dehydratase family protein [Chloroflexota bacterium]